MTAIPSTVRVIEKLRWNSHLGKHQHFEAAKRSRRLHWLLGVPPILISIVLGSVFFLYAGDKFLPNSAKLIGSSLALMSACLTGMQTFFNFRREYEGHRAIANQYLNIARECERLIALYFDNILSLEGLSTEISRLNKQYGDTNVEAELYSVRDQEYRKAFEIQKSKAKEEYSLVARMKELSGASESITGGNENECSAKN